MKSLRKLLAFLLIALLSVPMFSVESMAAPAKAKITIAPAVGGLEIVRESEEDQMVKFDIFGEGLNEAALVYIRFKYTKNVIEGRNIIYNDPAFMFTGGYITTKYVTDPYNYLQLAFITPATKSVMTDSNIKIGTVQFKVYDKQIQNFDLELCEVYIQKANKVLITNEIGTPGVKTYQVRSVKTIDAVEAVNGLVKVTYHPGYEELPVDEMTFKYSIDGAAALPLASTEVTYDNGVMSYNFAKLSQSTAPQLVTVYVTYKGETFTDTFPIEPYVRATAVKLSAPAMLNLKKGTTYTITAASTPANAFTDAPAEFTWISSNPAIASVTGNGSSAVVKGLTAGTVIITCIVRTPYGELKTTTSVKVTN